MSEANYYFKLSEYGDRIAALIESDELVIQPESRRNEILAFIKGGLEDLSISRTSFKWGITVPGNQDHVIYVWIDALANYLTALGYGAENPEHIARFEKYWPADLHLIGKEIIRFHCVYWLAILLAADLPLPKSITAHGWLLFPDTNNIATKISKSKGNIVRTETILDVVGINVYAVQNPAASKAQQDLFAADVLKYYLLREIPFGQDGNFSFECLVRRYNSDLANGYGNLVSRTLTMISNYFGEIPQPSSSNISSCHLAPVAAFHEAVEKLEFGKALEAVWTAIAKTDGDLSVATPWKLAKNEDAESRSRLANVLYDAAESIRIITALLHPVLPYATAKVWAQLGLGDIEESARKGELNNLQWGGLPPGTKLGPLAPIFPRANQNLVQIFNDGSKTN